MVRWSRITEVIQYSFKMTMKGIVRVWLFIICDHLIIICNNKKENDRNEVEPWIEK